MILCYDRNRGGRICERFSPDDQNGKLALYLETRLTKTWLTPHLASTATHLSANSPFAQERGPSIYPGFPF